MRKPACGLCLVSPKYIKFRVRVKPPTPLESDPRGCRRQENGQKEMGVGETPGGRSSLCLVALLPGRCGPPAAGRGKRLAVESRLGGEIHAQRCFPAGGCLDPGVALGIDDHD